MATEFISRKYGTEGYEVIIKTDSHEHCKASEEFARRLIDHAKPMTNADKIRDMTDEELAELFRDIYNAGCDYAQEWYLSGSRRSFFEWDEEWLQQPAEDD